MRPTPISAADDFAEENGRAGQRRVGRRQWRRPPRLRATGRAALQALCGHPAVQINRGCGQGRRQELTPLVVEHFGSAAAELSAALRPESAAGPRGGRGGRPGATRQHHALERAPAKLQQLAVRLAVAAIRGTVWPAGDRPGQGAAGRTGGAPRCHRRGGVWWDPALLPSLSTLQRFSQRLKRLLGFVALALAGFTSSPSEMVASFFLSALHRPCKRCPIAPVSEPAKRHEGSKRVVAVVQSHTGTHGSGAAERAPGRLPPGSAALVRCCAHMARLNASWCLVITSKYYLVA